jgi:hypothetical protein
MQVLVGDIMNHNLIIVKALANIPSYVQIELFYLTNILIIRHEKFLIGNNQDIVKIR